MATIVMVHGIGHEQTSADTLEDAWIPDLAGGVRIAGFPDIADRIVAERPHNDNHYGVRVAHYGHLFLTPGMQGAGGGRAPENDFASQLAEEWLERALDSPDTATRRGAEQIQFQRSGQGQAQGPGRMARPLVNSLTRLRWFTQAGVSFAGRWLNSSLRQVNDYFSDDGIRRKAIATVTSLITPNTTVIIGHSLGSVVAYEAIHSIDQEIPLLVTLGSPLGLGTVVMHRINPPAGFPGNVRRWVNVAGKDDIIAARPDLAPLFSGGIPAGAEFLAHNLVDTGSKPHQADYYLTKPTVGRAVGEALSAVG